MDVPCPDPDQVDGYLVVLHPAWEFARWKIEAERGGSPDGLSSFLGAMRMALPDVDASRYRGIQRDAIDRWWEGEPATGDRRPNDRARRRIWDLYGPDPCLRWSPPPWFDSDLLPSIEVAQEILLLADAPTDRELLRVTRGDTRRTSRTMGYDVGYWGNDHYSIIADAMVMPRWHGCPLDQFASLQPWATRLNEHVLFPEAAGGEEYLEWYLRQPWAEVDAAPGQLQVIRADAAP
jgi:hypothetical protein